MKSTMKRMTVGAALGGALFLSAGMGIANAQPRDGQVDLALGTAGVLEDVPIGAAAQVAAGVCDSDIGQITTLAETVDANGAQTNVCNNTVGAVEFRQNEGAPASAEEPQAAEESTDGASAEGTDSSTAPTTTTEEDSGS
ncbi:hypothetical protein [Mycolicibacterium goodii]|uniref:Secreted protein n=1 Tax=Mycolicibacterium goodii TaxID=134601 RepID=A0ABS6HKA7_MYCGD|nr:hypothetical protein [Mycolicibacterium goodii]MBU8821813.1 hypothetical protein [Mycolicibacterium goodii]MBU8836805.1 hypothetical protein [Mycolicibacterium goodii]